MTRTIVYDIQDLTKRYPGRAQPANDSISLEVGEGEIFGILGDNGAGKSTLVRQMANLLRPTAGRIALYGRDLTDDVLRVPMLVGYMPQDGRALNNLTVGEALFFAAHLRGLTRGDARLQRDRLLELWEIGALRDLPSPRLSGGQLRMLRLAVATAGDPPVLILDEPTNDLDPQRRRLVWGVLRQINRERGATLIFITHDAIEAEKIIQRVAIMRGGRLAAQGRPADLKRAVDRTLRLELLFAPAAPPQLPPGLAPREIEPGRWLVLLEWADVVPTLAALDRTQIEDFRLHSATLEDLYLHYADGNAGE
jgi:ABC-2 type transport system ATP-binding protein